MATILGFIVLPCKMGIVPHGVERIYQKYISERALQALKCCAHPDWCEGIPECQTVPCFHLKYVGYHPRFLWYMLTRRSKERLKGS